MARQSIKRLLTNIDYNWSVFRKEVSCRQRFVYNVLDRYRLQWSKAEKDDTTVPKDAEYKSMLSSKEDRNVYFDSSVNKYGSSDEDSSHNKWKIELAWITKALEPAIRLSRWALQTGEVFGNKTLPGSRSLMEIVASIQRSKVGLQDWSLSDLTIGLYLIYLQQASKKPIEDVNGVLISSGAIVHDLIYHLELAKGTYRDGTAGLARNSMLRENNILKFIRESSVMRPGYYIGVDFRKKLVILGIRGTQTVYDLITDIVTSSHEEVTFEGYSMHFGTAEAARWFLRHEIGTLRKLLEKHEGFRLRLVGHSLGGATAALLAIMLRKKSSEELGFSPDIVTAVGYATPPCVSKELAECCSDYVSTVVMQDDIVPRLSVASLTRLRNEILQTDWMKVLEKEDWKNVVGLVTNAKHFVTSVQDVAKKLADYAQFRGETKVSGKEMATGPGLYSSSTATKESGLLVKKEETSSKMVDELFIPGNVYFLRRHFYSGNDHEGREFFTLLKRNPGEHFHRIRLSANLISDHKCDTHLYALRDVIKGFPGHIEETIYK